MIRRELAVFLIVGSLTVVIDFLAYRKLLWSGVLPLSMAKATSFLIGTAFAYFANRAWTFNRQSHASGSAWRFMLLYALTLGANVVINATVLHLLTDAAMVTSAMHIAFLLATGVSAFLNFVGMKLFVFKSAT